jgi:hypothetical protein
MANNEVFKQAKNVFYVDLQLDGTGLLAATNLPASFNVSSVVSGLTCIVRNGVDAGKAKFAIQPPACTAVGANAYTITGAGSSANDTSKYRLYYTNGYLNN